MSEKDVSTTRQASTLMSRQKTQMPEIMGKALQAMRDLMISLGRAQMEIPTMILRKCLTMGPDPVKKCKRKAQMLTLIWRLNSWRLYRARRKSLHSIATTSAKHVKVVGAGLVHIRPLVGRAAVPAIKPSNKVPSPFSRSVEAATAMEV